MYGQPEIVVVRDGRNSHLYRCYNDADRVIYVGRAQEPARRCAQHRANSPWWNEVVRVEVELGLGHLEPEQIGTLRPEHNRVGNPDWLMPSPGAKWVPVMRPLRLDRWNRPPSTDYRVLREQLPRSQREAAVASGAAR